MFVGGCSETSLSGGACILLESLDFGVPYVNYHVHGAQNSLLYVNFHPFLFIESVFVSAALESHAYF